MSSDFPYRILSEAEFQERLKRIAPEETPPVFHTHVLNIHAVPIDIDRARFLAVTDLWNEVARECEIAGETDPQIFWDRYCAAHKARYGDPFPPDVRETPL